MTQQEKPPTVSSFSEDGPHQFLDKNIPLSDEDYSCLLKKYILEPLERNKSFYLYVLFIRTKNGKTNYVESFRRASIKPARIVMKKTDDINIFAAFQKNLKHNSVSQVFFLMQKYYNGICQFNQSYHCKSDKIVETDTYFILNFDIHLYRRQVISENPLFD